MRKLFSIVSILILNLTFAQKPELVIPTNHSGEINDVCISPDSKYVITASDDNTVKLWELQTGRLIRTLVGHIDEVYAVCFFDDGKYIISADGELICVWQLSTGALLRSFPEMNNDFIEYLIELKPSKERLASLSSELNIDKITFDLKSGDFVVKYTQAPGSPYSVGFINDVSYDPTGKIVFFACDDKEIHMVEAVSGNEIRSFKGHSGDVESIDISRNGELLISAQASWDDGTIKLWDIESGVEVDTLNISGDNVQFAIDDKYMILSDYRRILLWDFETENDYWFGGNNSRIGAIDISPDNQYIVSGNDFGELLIWKNESKSIIKRRSIYAGWSERNCTISLDKKKVISEQSFIKYAFLRLYDLETETFEDIIRVDRFTSHMMSFVNISPDEKYIVYNDLGKVIIVNLETGKIIKKLPFKGKNMAYHANGMFFNSSKQLLIHDEDLVIIYDIESGNELYRYNNFSSPITDLTIAQFKHFFISGHQDNSLVITFLDPGKPAETLKGHSQPITALCISSDEQYGLSGSKDSTIILWDIPNNGIKRTLIGHQDEITCLDFSPDGKYAISGSKDNMIKIWNLDTGNEVFTFTELDYPEMVAFISDNGDILSSTGGSVETWNYHDFYNENTGQVINTQPLNKDNSLYQVVDIFIPPLESLLYYEQVMKTPTDQTTKLTAWDFQSGMPTHCLIKDLDCLSSYFDSTKSYILGFDPAESFSDDSNSLSLWSLDPPDSIKSFTGKDKFRKMTLVSWDGEFAAGINDDELQIWNIQTGDQVFTFKEKGIRDFAFSHDSKLIAVAEAKDFFLNFHVNMHLFNIQSGKKILSLNKSYIQCVNFTIDDKYILFGEFGDINILDISSEEVVGDYNAHSSGITKISCSKDGRYILTGGSDNTVILWEIVNKRKYGEETIGLRKLNTFKGHSSPISFVGFSQNEDKVITSSLDNTIKIWDLKTAEEIVTMISMDSLNWIVTTPNGLFDASPSAMNNIYYVQGTEIIDLEQLKERYYEPGLLKQVMNSEPLREVKAFGDTLSLFPSVNQTTIDEMANLDILLNNQGGGIGKVSVFINGKEIISDARQDGFDQNVTDATISANIKDHPYLTSGDNKIEVKAYNAEGYLSSRNVGVIYNPGIDTDIEPPDLYVLVSGVSDYTGDKIDLRFAAKDAVDISNALEIGAHRLFGTDKTYLYELTTDEEDKNNWPTKENIEKAFMDIASKAKSTDVLVVYLAGHGINWGGQDGDFYYLTQDAYTANGDAYNDPAIRNSCTISSDTLVEWFKKVPALKQVLIIDACASGQLVENLQQDRDIASSTIRALERMKDRTGMHIITGCAADAVSYEASRYGQGVLTYSLIEGMKGVALREEKFADVNLLFQHAVERVPQLAEGVGGIQEPEVFSPYGAESFDIGLYTKQDKEQIALAKIKPMFIRSNFLDENELRDVLDLGNKLDEELNELASRGEEAKFIFVDVGEFPEAYQLSGLYKQTDGKIKLRMNINYGEESEVVEVEAGTVEDLIGRIVEIINQKD